MLTFKPHGLIWDEKFKIFNWPITEIVLITYPWLIKMIIEGFKLMQLKYIKKTDICALRLKGLPINLVHRLLHP